MKHLLLLLLVLGLVACGSSDALRIVETGFSAVETAPGQWIVKLESDRIRTAEEADANLLVHSARWAIDVGAVYFTLSDKIVGSESEISLDQRSTEEAGAGVPTVTSSSSGGYTSSTTGKRSTEWTVRATLRVFREKPDTGEGDVFEASRVLDQYRSIRRTGAVSSGAGMRTN